MVFYFSGTGNSEYVATTIANFLSMDKRFIPETDPNDIDDTDDQLIFVFPVYSWGVPPLILKFIELLGERFWTKVTSNDITVNCVMICGDEVAMAPEMMERQLKKFGVELHSVWSVIMPNNYVLLPGFDVDSKDIEKRKLDDCKGRIIEITESLNRRERKVDVVRGSFPRLKTRIVYPLFKRWGIFPKKWYYTESCIGCKKCSLACPLSNVEMKNGHPEWGSRCCSCLACYHVCPVHAVEYSTFTKNKGQYFFPLKKISLLNCHK